MTNSTKTPISEIHLRALYSLLPGVLKENLYGPRFSKQFQVWREFVHPSGTTDIRTLDGFDGMSIQVNLGDRLGCDVYYGFFQEYYDYSLFMALLSPNDVVIDIGANYGMYTLGAAKRISPQGRVVAFEPDVRSMSLLKENARLNNYEELVTCLDVCIGDYDGEVNFYATIDPSFSGIHDTKRSETANSLTLPIRRLDSVLQEKGVNQVNLIKIDVEGAEYEVLEGAMGTLAASDAIIMMEISSKNLDMDRREKLSATLGRLEAQGYISYRIDCEGTYVKLIRDDSLTGIVQRLEAGQMGNYFFLRYDKKRCLFFQEKFKSLNLTFSPSREDIAVRAASPSAMSHEDDDHMPIPTQSEACELDNLEAMLWAERVEKKIAVDYCSKLHHKMYLSELQLAELGNKLAASLEENSIFKVKIVGATQQLNASAEVKPAETGKEVVTLMEENAVFRAALAETNATLVSVMGETAIFKDKLAKTSKKLADKDNEISKELEILNDGLLGVLFRIKKRLLNRGSFHG